MRKNIIRICIIAVAFPVASFAKTPGPGDSLESKILNAINVFYQAYPHEEIHLQFNKNAYAPGEDVWFKSYLLPFHDTTYNSISKIEYVELIDMNNRLVKRLVLPVINGTSEGYFKLSAFGEGVYHVRAYTAWMLNFDTAFFFNRDIPVFTHSYSVQNVSAGKNYVVKFYPEGGSLVEGLTSQVAYKAADEYGNPVSISGKIMDDKGNTRALLQTGADGLGSFNMHPEEGFSYSAVTQSQTDTTLKTFALPAIQKSGVVLHVVDKPDSAGNSKLYFHIARSKFQKELYTSIIICAHTAKYNRLLAINFDPKYAGDYNDTILVAGDPLELKNDGDNIAHITVFNREGEPLADRIVFLHSSNAISPASLSPVTINATGKNEFLLTVPGDVQGQYSVAVTKADGNGGNNDESSIFSDFYLPGIQNYIANPAGYFTDTSSATRYRLNLLMLTNKWNYFTWKAALAGRFMDVAYRPEQTLIIKGSVTTEKYGKKGTFDEKTIPLMIRDDRDSIKTFLNIPVDEQGDFTEGNLFFHDTASFYYQGSVQKSKKTVSVVFNKTETDSILSLPFYYKPYRKIIVTAAAVKPAFKQGNAEAAQPPAADSSTLKAVTVKAAAKSRIDSLDAVYTSGIFSVSRNFIRTFDLTDDVVTENDHVRNVLQFLQGRVPGLVITGDIQSTPEMYWRLTTGLLTNNRAVDPIGATILNMPVFFINERQVNSNELIAGGGKEQLAATMSQLINLKVADIAYIKVYEPGTFYGVEGGAAHGAIAIYLKQGYDEKSNINLLKKAGFSQMPAYKDNEFNAVDKQTIYWNPAVFTNPATHTATITFTNNTGAKRIKIVVEGFDKKGSLVRIEKIFEQ
ncbi:MAG TPA: hypothetical protein VG738_14280 [Chitinophagaceae bacterium]|nr:hypothetical protein [Chitinophagaceae bacterium]